MTRLWMPLVAVFAMMSTTADAESGRAILDAVGIPGGVVVHLGCGDGKLTAELGADGQFIVQGLDADPKNVAKAKKTIRDAGVYGRVTAGLFSGTRLPYPDNFVNFVVSEDLRRVPMDEVVRVLAPLGIAYIKQGGKWKKTVKPWPAEIDEWTHCQYDATGNAVAHDTRVAPPRHIQWVGGPRRARQHENTASISVVVSAGGRMFSIQDEGSIASVIMPPKWFLVARDAFNGVVLWKRDVGPWEDHLRGFRSGPPELARRLVAVDDKVFVTLGYGKPVSALDAATGKTLRTYIETEGTSEIVFCDDVLYLVLDKPKLDQSPEAARRKRDATPLNRRIIALEAGTGKKLWEKSDADAASVMPTTLAAANGCVFFQSLDAVVCLNAKSGKEIWRAERPVAPRRPSWSSPTLVIYDDVVFSADRAMPAQLQKNPTRKHPAGWVDAPMGQLIAMSAKTGEVLWSCECRESYHAPVDVLVADGLVWTGEVAHMNDPGITAGRDPKTGEIKRRRPIDQEFFQVGMPHHRCYRNRATNRYLLLGRAGVEFIDLASGEGIANHWVRGTCQYGIVPCNGLLYAPPHSCACFIKAKLNGFCALAGKKAEGRKLRAEENDTFERGPAYGEIQKLKPAVQNAEDWPTYRHDPQRSGVAGTKIPADLKPVWETEIGGRLTSPTIADGKVFVAAVDKHAVCAFDASDGRPLWQYIAGGRVDSPSTIYDGMALFGCADGCVYCLRASDGHLVWRRRAVPEDRRIVAYAQVESVWPVHGSVLIDNGVAYVAAGRSSYLDGGIRFIGLDPKTGDKLVDTCIDSRDPKTARQPKGSVHGFDLPGALPDVLSSDGRSIYMRHLALDRKGVVQPQAQPHLFCPTGLLDDSWWHRSYWIFGTSFYTGYRDWFRAGREVPGGRMLLVDESTVYGFGRTAEYYYWSTPQKYHLFATDKRPKIVDSPKKRPRAPRWGQREIVYRWSRKIPFQVRAMVLADKTLFAAGPPEFVDEKAAYEPATRQSETGRLTEHDAALAGKKGALLWAVSATDGTPLAKRRLDSPPVWDGMAAARDRLYLSTQNGRLICLGRPALSKTVPLTPSPGRRP